MSTPDAKRPTSAAVAARAGVSRATVSYILNGKTGVSFAPETKDAVLRAAAEFGYRPNAAARSLAAGQGPVVFAISNEPHNEISLAGYGALSHAFSVRGVLTTVVQVADDITRAVDDLIALRPRAVVFVVPTSDEMRQRLTDAGIAVLSLPSDADMIIGELQVAYLVAQGHTHIAAANVEHSDRFGVLPRADEVLAACATRGLSTPPVAGFSRRGEGAADIVRDWHERGVTAVCAYNDEIALAVLHGIRQAGLRCPDDIAVIGCDDVAAAAVAAPPLTTVAFDADLDIELLADELLSQLGSGTPPEHRPALTPVAGVIVRESA